MKKIIIIVLALALVVSAFFLLSRDKKDLESLYKLEKVKKGSIVNKALAIGTIEPENEIKVKTVISGIISEVYFKTGDFVEKGKPLFKVSPNPTPIEYADSGREVEIASAAMLNNKRELDRQIQLFKSKLISQSKMDEVEFKYKQSLLRYKKAIEKFQLMDKGRVKMAKKSIDSVVRAPISGIVLSQSVYKGDPVVPLTSFQPGTELCAMADMKKLVFKGTVDEIDVGKLKAGQNVDIKIGALPDSDLKGSLERISPKAKKEDNSTLFDVEASLNNNSDIKLRAGFSANAHIIIKEVRDILVVPERLVLFKDDKTYVEVLKGEKIEKKEIKIGLSDGMKIEVKEGLTINDSIVDRPLSE